MDEKKNEYLGTLKFMGQDEDRNFYVQVEIVRSGPNRNGWDFQNMETLSKSFLGTPLLCAYLPNQIGDGHNFREKTLPTGEQILDFTGPTAERIVGAISDDPADLWTEVREDGTWAIAKGKIWRFYNRQLVDRLALQGSMSVSAEIETHKGYVNDEGIEVYTDWTGLGVTLLHESVPPAVPGANIQAIRAMSEEFKEMKFKAASYHGESEEEEAEQEQDLATLSAEEKPVNEENPTRKGVNLTMSFNRREAERLAPKFEGYRIVGLSEDSSQVILMSDSYGLYSYKFSEEFGEEVVASAIQPVTNISVLCGSVEDGVTADMDEIVKNLADTINEQKATISNLNAQLETVNADCEALRQNEHDRRIEMVKESIQKALADISEACDNADSAENCDNEAADMEANAEQYASMEANGKFCGHTAAYDELMSAYGKKVTASRKEAKAKTMAQFAWNRTDKDADAQNDDGIAGLLSRING